MAPRKKTLTDTEKEDLLIQLAKEVLERRAKTGKAAAEPEEVDWTKEKRVCPKCEHKGSVIPDFGTTTVRGVTRPQSWCRSCRASTNYHSRPRKYETGR